MKVDPAELVGLARLSEETAADLRQRWTGAGPGREVPREAWGDLPSASLVSATYDAASLAAGSALSALVAALELGAPTPGPHEARRAGPSGARAERDRSGETEGATG